jgi:hypothetical protein
MEDTELSSLLCQILCLIFTALYSVCNYNNLKKCLLFGVLAMLFANIFGQTIIAGGGPRAFVGFVILPLEGVVVALGTVYITRFVMRLRKGDK